MVRWRMPEDQGPANKKNELPLSVTVLKGGLFAVVLGSIAAAISVFQITSPLLGHVFMGLAALAGSLAIHHEIVPRYPIKHKWIATVGLCVLIALLDFTFGKLKSAAILPGGTKDQATAAREAIGAMGLKFNKEDFTHSVREGDINTISLYLKGGMSPNAVYNHAAFALELGLGNSDFPEIVHTFQAQGNQKLDFKATSPDSPLLMASWVFRGVSFPIDRPVRQEEELFVIAANRANRDAALALMRAGADDKSTIELLDKEVASYKLQLAEVQQTISRSERTGEIISSLDRGAPANISSHMSGAQQSANFLRSLH